MADTIYPTSIIYKITNTINGKFYVGHTSQGLTRRWKQHCYTTTFGSTYHLHNAIRKYGPAVFTQTILEQTAPNIVQTREQYWIAKLNPQYNMTSGGEGMPNPTPETRARLSASRRGRGNSFYGKTHSDETRQKIGNANRGRPCSPEARNKIGEQQRLVWADPTFHAKMCTMRQGKNSGNTNPMFGRVGPANPRFGHTHTDAAKAKMSAASKLRNSGAGNPMYGKKQSPETIAKRKFTRLTNQRLRDLDRATQSPQEKSESLCH